jgi:hypothetical protein
VNERKKCGECDRAIYLLKIVNLIRINTTSAPVTPEPFNVPMYNSRGLRECRNYLDLVSETCTKNR